MMMAADLLNDGESAERLWCTQLVRETMKKVVDEQSKLGDKKQKG